MKASTILSIALSAVAVSASPVDVGSPALEKRDNGYCCLIYRRQLGPNSAEAKALYGKRWQGIHRFTVDGCVWDTTAPRDNDCDWKFTAVTLTCPERSLEVAEADVCARMLGH
ncbi:hypothetical protein E4U55_006683 [Claviceps digitariae]|nr:hypothetical protein E4U55_006683 [Claviceps digitariae]